MLDVELAYHVIRFLLDNGYTYPNKSIGLRALSNVFSVSPNKMRRVLRNLRRFGLIVRDIDPYREKYVRYALKPSIRYEEMLRILSKFIMFYNGDFESLENFDVYQWIDSRLDRYYITGTTSLLLRGYSWNLIAPSGLLIFVDEREFKSAKKVVKKINDSELGLKMDIVKGDIRKREYGFIRMQNQAVPVASIRQGIIDSLAHPFSVGVDLLETISVLLGILLEDWINNISIWERIKELIQRQYDGGKQSLITSIIKEILLRLYTYFEDVRIWNIYMLFREFEKIRLRKEIEQKISAAIRDTILGDKVACALGLEPDFFSPQEYSVNRALIILGCDDI